MMTRLASRLGARLFSLSGMTVLATALLLAGCQSTSQQDVDEGAQVSGSHFGHFPFKLRSDGKQCRANWQKAPPLQPDLWDRVQRRYELPNSSTNPRIVTERNWYANHQAYLDRMSGRAARYLYHVANKLEERQLPGELALLPIVESSYNPFALSRSQASGLWQFIPSTAKHLKMDMNWWFDARRDIPESTDTALDYLIFLRDHYNGDWLKALAAYNAGWGTIDRAVEKNRARGLPTDYWNLDVPAETRAYVPKLLALAQISRDPEAYGVHWAYIPDLPYFTEVRIPGQMDIAHAADMANISSDELHLLNPGISRWVTPPGGPHRLLVPVDQANEFAERIASLDNSGSTLFASAQQDRMMTANPMVQEMERKATARQAIPAGARSYTIKAGDTLWSVAKREGVSADEIRRLNKMGNDTPLRLGDKLALPRKGKTVASNSSSPVSSGKAAPGKPVASKAAGGKTTYKVQSGDTLMAIARKHKLDVNDLARWNALDKNRATLKPGQLLTLYLKH